ncbi:MAG: CocE/NonD family hydrolase [Chlorogloea purpurea SAG 13.99]|nr:CocE/NonD family hydrolase [Chlorogloea purpurea SAG 13.99]
MYTRDGIRLDADIYRPDNREKLPILLMRQPYGRSIASTVVYAHPIWYAQQGYIVVIQDVRGRGTSEGEFNLFAHERDDGWDTLNWLMDIPDSTGEVGMYGFSYQGMTQLYAAIDRPPNLKTICPAMIAYDLYTDWAYENGAFCLQANLGWAIQLSAETARLKGDEVSYQKLYGAARNLPLYDLIPASPSLLTGIDPHSFYHQWLRCYSGTESYWAQLSPKNLLQGVDLPMLHLGGWFDPYLRGTLNLYRHMKDFSVHPQHLIIGPWSHLPWSPTVGSKDYGVKAVNGIDNIQLQWFDRFLKGKYTPIREQKSVALFEMGSNDWRYKDDLTNNQEITFYLNSNGLAHLREDDGILTQFLSESLSSVPDIIVHDPWRPVPSSGGHNSYPGGAFERATLDNRSDVLTYTSAPLENDLSILGIVRVYCNCEADAVSYDLCAVLSEVSPDRKVYNFTQGYIRVNSPHSPVIIPLQATSIRIAAGQRLRLSLAASCFPAHPVNPGTGNYPHQTQLIEAQIITIKIKCQAVHGTKIILPTA